MSSPATAQQLPERQMVASAETWDLSSIFAAPTDWESACSTLREQLPEMAAYRGRLGEGPETLVAALGLRESLSIAMGKIGVYASNGVATDTTDQIAAAREGQAAALRVELAAALSFFIPELIAVGLDQIEQWIVATPALAHLQHFIDTLRRQQAHLRSHEVEEVLAQLGESHGAPQAIYGKLVNADLHFRPALDAQGSSRDVGQSNLTALLADPDPVLRRSAWESQADAYHSVRNSTATALIATLRQHAAMARIRGYASSVDAAFAARSIPVAVYHNMLTSFREHLPVWHRYWRFRRAVNGGQRPGVHDLKAPLGSTSPQVSFEQAVDWICAGMAPLGDEYVSIMRRGCLEQRWVDRACNRGKRKGAFSSGSVGTHPFILLSYHNDFSSLSTLAHELGHSMHSWYTRGCQPHVYANYTLFLGETASTFNQAMVRDYLLRTEQDRDVQIALLEEALSNFHRYLFVMPTLARFECEIHRRAEHGEALNAGIFSDLITDLFAEGYGDEVDLDRARVGTTWAHLGQIFSNFYVNDYATGISAAHALARPILAGDDSAVERYLGMLKAGSSRDSLDTMHSAGVDMTSPTAISAAFAVLESHIERLEELCL